MVKWNPARQLVSLLLLFLELQNNINEATVCDHYYTDVYNKIYKLRPLIPLTLLGVVLLILIFTQSPWNFSTGARKTTNFRYRTFHQRLCLLLLLLVFGSRP